MFGPQLGRIHSLRLHENSLACQENWDMKIRATLAQKEK